MPRFSDLFMLLIQMGITPDVSFQRYQSVSRYADFEEALAQKLYAIDGEAYAQNAGESGCSDDAFLYARL